MLCFSDGGGLCCVSVMEVACGEYGDMVPSLVVAVKAYKCEQFQSLQKFTNCGKNVVEQWHQDVVSLKETPILDDNVSDTEDAPLNSGDTHCNGSHSVKVVMSKQNGKCDLTVSRQVRPFSC